MDEDEKHLGQEEVQMGEYEVLKRWLFINGRGHLGQEEVQSL